MTLSPDDRLKLELVINGIEEQGSTADVTAWERSFMDDQAQRLEEWGERMRLSDEQWDIINRIYDKVVV